MGIVPCSIILWLMIAAALATTDLFSENQPSSSKDDIFSDRTPGVPVGRLDLQASNGIASLDVGGTNWLLDDGKIDLDSGARSSSNLFFSDDGDLPSFKESNSNSSPDMLDWNLQPQPDLGSPLPDAALNSLVSSLEPNFLLQESIWDDINPPLADNQVGCEFSPADDIALSGKRRRETKCKNPDLRNPSNDRGLDPYNPSPVPWAQHNDPLNYAFSEEFELCAKRIFKDANLPVCKEQYPPPDQIYTEPQLLWAHLYDVSPSTSVQDSKHSRCIDTQLLTKQSSCFIFGTVALPQWTSSLVLRVNPKTRR